MTIFFSIENIYKFVREKKNITKVSEPKISTSYGIFIFLLGISVIKFVVELGN